MSSLLTGRLDALPFDVITKELDPLSQAVANKLQRQWPVRWKHMQDAAVVLNGTVLVSINTFRTIRYFCADYPADPARRLEYALSVPPLCRTILDSVFTAIFLFEDFENRFRRYHQSGWRELYEKQQLMVETYGSDLKWAEWIAGHGAFVDDLEHRAGITGEQKADLNKITYWPNPGRMHKQAKSEKTKNHLIYLNNWFYKNLSSASHLALPGLMERSAMLMRYLNREEDEAHIEESLQQSRSNAIGTTTALFVALLSEVQAGIGWDLQQRCHYLWGILSQMSDQIKELYELRYRALLS
jgi:hypothetical protein